MATFRPNPHDDEEPWIEKAALEGSGLRIWHVMFFCLSIFTGLVIFICCCVKMRIPRTKQEIEANYRRKKLVAKFRERIRLIQNQDMDEIDLKRALEIIQEDYKMEIDTLEERQLGCDVTNNLKAEPQQPNTRFMQLTRIASLIRRTDPPESQC